MDCNANILGDVGLSEGSRATHRLRTTGLDSLEIHILKFVKFCQKQICKDSD